VGATGIVRRLIELAQTLDADASVTARTPFPCEPTTRIGAAHHDAVIEEVPHVVAANGSRNGASAASASITTNGHAP
jgi:hypothetical protein